MNFEMSPDMILQSCSSSDMYPTALDDADLCLAMNDPSNYWLDDSWQWSPWPTTSVIDATALAATSDDTFLPCSAVQPMQTVLDYNNNNNNNTTTFGYPEELQLAVSDYCPVAQPVSEAHVESAQAHGCEKVQALEERIDVLEKLLASHEIDPFAALQAYAKQMQEWQEAFMERAEALAEEVRSATGQATPSR